MTVSRESPSSSIRISLARRAYAAPTVRLRVIDTSCSRSASLRFIFPIPELHHNWGAISMGQWTSDGNQLVAEFLGQTPEGALFGFTHFGLIAGQAMLDVIDALDHGAPEQDGQLSGQGDVGYEPAAPCRQAAIEA